MYPGEVTVLGAGAGHRDTEESCVYCNVPVVTSHQSLTFCHCSGPGPGHDVTTTVVTIYLFLTTNLRTVETPRLGGWGWFCDIYLENAADSGNR